MARLFKHGREVLRLERYWQQVVNDEDTEDRVVRAVLIDERANGDTKVTILNKRQWRYTEAYCDEHGGNYLRRPHGTWNVYAVAYLADGDWRGYVNDVVEAAADSRWDKVERK